MPTKLWSGTYAFTTMNGTPNGDGTMVPESSERASCTEVWSGRMKLQVVATVGGPSVDVDSSMVILLRDRHENQRPFRTSADKIENVRNSNGYRFRRRHRLGAAEQLAWRDVIRDRSRESDRETNGSCVFLPGISLT